jgi:hypothetical protein
MAVEPLCSLVLEVEERVFYVKSGNLCFTSPFHVGPY